MIKIDKERKVLIINEKRYYIPMLTEEDIVRKACNAQPGDLAVHLHMPAHSETYATVTDTSYTAYDGISGTVYGTSYADGSIDSDNYNIGCTDSDGFEVIVKAIEVI